MITSPKYSNKEPLVSICIPNYNYGKYLRDCLDGVCNQTYSNIEVIFSDNNSSDNSLDIALEYEKKYRNKFYFFVRKNKFNIGSDQNANLCINESSGNYKIILGSDDIIKNTFIEKCINVAIKYPEMSFIMTHRDEIDENNNIYKSKPFFNTNCICDSDSIASVFMMSGIAIPSQCIFSSEYRLKALKYKRTSFQIAGDWYINFLLACVGSVGYLKDNLVEYRIHSKNETTYSEKNLLGIFEHYQLINEFHSIAAILNMEKTFNRYPEAVEKLGTMCLRYARKMLINNEKECARRYLDLAPVFKKDIQQDPVYNKLQMCVRNNDKEFIENIINDIKNSPIIVRNISYDPPSGYQKID